VESGTETERIYSWRRDELIRAGYTVQQAEVLAYGHCDLHEAIELARAVLKAGHDVSIAFDIESDGDDVQAVA
jgi:hypothetical protein